jgi:hypothetical protein
MNSCTKDNLVSHDNTFSVQKCNPTEDYPFVLTDNSLFEYAVYQKDMEDLSVYIESVIEEQEENQGCFVLCLEREFIYYRFLSEYRDNPNNPDIPVCMSFREFHKYKDAWAFAKEKLAENNIVYISKVGGKYGNWCVEYYPKP